MGWNLPGGRYDEIRTAVADLIEDWGIREYPFSIQSLLRKMRIRLIPYSTLSDDLRSAFEADSSDAFTIYPTNYDPSRTIICYNDEPSRERIRFTLAHELAHPALMHPGTGEDIYEHEADIFANYLLVPAPLVLEYSRIDYEVISHDFVIGFKCARSARDRIRKRREYGPSSYLEYEQRILDLCTLNTDSNQLAQV